MSNATREVLGYFDNQTGLCSTRGRTRVGTRGLYRCFYLYLLPFMLDSLCPKFRSMVRVTMHSFIRNVLFTPPDLLTCSLVYCSSPLEVSLCLSWGCTPEGIAEYSRKVPECLLPPCQPRGSLLLSILKGGQEEGEKTGEMDQSI